MNHKKGFTLIEVIVVLAILSIVSGAVISVFMFSNRTFSNSNRQAEFQFEARQLMNDLRSSVGVAANIYLAQTVPLIYPETLSGYCFMEPNNRIALLKPDGSVKYYFQGADLSDDISISFIPMQSTSESGSDDIEVYNMIRVRIESDTYFLESDIFIQNLEEYKGSISYDYSIEDDTPPAIYLEFE